MTDFDVEAALAAVTADTSTVAGRRVNGWKYVSASRFVADGQLLFFEAHTVQQWSAMRPIGLRIKRSLQWELDPSGVLHLLPAD